MYLGGRKNILYRFIQGEVPDIKKIRKMQKKVDNDFNIN